MIRTPTSVRRIAMVAVSLFLSAQLAPSVALACEGGGEEAGGELKDSGNINYGKVVPPATAKGTVTVEDDFFGFNIEVGTASMKLEEGNGFTIENDKCSKITMKLGETCTIGVLFSPLLATKYKSTLIVPWSAAGGLYKGEPKSTQTGEG